MSSIGTGVRVALGRAIQDVVTLTQRRVTGWFRARQYDLSATTFSPDGRVFQVEYATKAVENGGYAAAAGGRRGRLVMRPRCSPAASLLLSPCRSRQDVRRRALQGWRRPRCGEAGRVEAAREALEPPHQLGGSARRRGHGGLGRGRPGAGRIGPQPGGAVPRLLPHAHPRQGARARDQPLEPTSS